MDDLLSKLGAQVLSYAIRSGIALTSSYAVGQCSRLLKTVADQDTYSELKRLQKLLNSKIRIVSPAISLIELKSGRGNPLLVGAIPLARSLHRDIIRLGRRLESAASAEEVKRSLPTTAKAAAATAAERRAEIRGVIAEIKALLARLDADIPSLQLAISVSGESLTTNLPPGISPSRLLQANMLLTIGDTQYALDPTRPTQIGPAFTLSIYMLFLGHAAGPARHGHDLDDGRGGRGGSGSRRRPVTPSDSSGRHSVSEEDAYGLGEGDRKPVWQEVMHKARARLCRTPPDHVFDPIEGYRPDAAAGDRPRPRRPVPGPPILEREPGLGGDYAYHIEIIEDLDDGRVHDDSAEGAPPPRGYDTVAKAGIRESIPIHQLSKLFYTDTGSILNIGNAAEGDNNPVLLLKRDVRARRPGRLDAGTGDGNTGGAGWEEGLEADFASQLGLEEDTDGESDTAEGSVASHDSQLDIERQLREESQARGEPRESGAEETTGETERRPEPQSRPTLRFPAHLDLEWLALEAFVEEDEDDEDEDDGDGDGDGEDQGSPRSDAVGRRLMKTPPKSRLLAYGRSSLDSRLIAQIKNLPLRQSPGRARPDSAAPYLPSSPARIRAEHHEDDGGDDRSDDRSVEQAAQQASFVARSPFGAITTSLSLMEMLIRLASLQEFQQASCLSIPDYMLTFFLQETSTTGLMGEEGRRARSLARRRVGFDPYTDTPTK